MGYFDNLSFSFRTLTGTSTFQGNYTVLKKNEFRHFLIVLGMHRSGTSAMAGVLQEMGCDLPKNLMAPEEINPNGFFESNVVTSLNEAILASAGLSWFDQNRFPAAWYASPKAEELRKHARAALQDEFGETGLYIMKDPRLCRLVPFWEQVFKDQNVHPLYICIHRNPVEVAASLQKWAGYDPPYGQTLWLRHVLDAESSTRGKKRVFVSYDQLLSDWRHAVTNISDNLDLVFPRTLATAAQGMDKFLSASLKHFSSKHLDIQKIEETSDWMATTFEVLSRWSQTGEEPFDYPTLDKIRFALDGASGTIVALSNELLARYRENERQSAQLGEANIALANTEASLNLVRHTFHETWLQTQAQQKDLNNLAYKLHAARSRPLRNLVTHYEFRALRFLSSKGSPLSTKMKSRFSRSAKKRSPDSDMPKLAEIVATQSNRSANLPSAQGQPPFRPDLPTVIVVSHDASRTGAPILALNLAKTLSARYNVATICLRGGELAADFGQVSTLAYVAQQANGTVLPFADMLDEITAQRIPTFAVINSIESRHILGALYERHIPSIALLHEFASYTFPKTAFSDAFYLADEIVFSSELTIQNALEQTSFVRTPRFQVIAQGRCEVPRSETEVALRRAECELLTAKLRPEGEKTGEFLVIGAGFVQFRKGVDLFIDVARRVLSTKEGQNARFAWIGGGYDPERDAAYSGYLKDQIDRAGLTDRMIMLGETSEIEHVYKSSNLLLLTSRLDPLPNVAIDALSHGIPVVCFDKTTGIADLLTEAGLRDTCVADYLDTEQAAKKVLRFIRSPEIYQRVCDTSKEFAKRAFDFGTYAARIEELGLRARRARSSQQTDISTIAATQDFDSDFMLPRQRKSSTKMKAAEYYRTEAWREAAPRKPEPGFNPLMFSRHLQSKGILDVEPYSAFLQQGRPHGPWLRTVIRETSNTSSPKGKAPLRTALHIHVYYPDIVATIVQRLALNKAKPDLFISAKDRECLDTTVEMLKGYQGRIAESRVVINRGRDIGPLLTEFGGQLLRDYDVIGHVHTKKSAQLTDREAVHLWSSLLYENMIGGRHGGAMIDRIMAAFTLNESLGIAFPADPNIMAWSNNADVARKLAPRLGVERLPEFFDFPIGSMFWGRVAVLQPFVALGLGWQDYPPEPVGMDGTILHAMERLFGVVAESRGLDIAVTNVKGVIR